MLAARKTLSPSICFVKLIFNEAILKPRLEGRKEHESELKLVSSPAATASLDKQVTGQLLICLEK